MKIENTRAVQKSNRCFNIKCKQSEKNKIDNILRHKCLFGKIPR